MSKLTDDMRSAATKIKSGKPPVDNDSEYRSLKQYGKEYLGTEQGAAIRGAMVGVPLAIAGGLAGAHYAKNIVGLAKKMPKVVQKGLRWVRNKTNPAQMFDPNAKRSVVEKAFMDKLFSKYPDISMADAYEALSTPAIQTGAAGAGLGLMLGNYIGEYGGARKGLRKAEEKSGYKPSTEGQFIARYTAGKAGDISGMVLGALTGATINKYRPRVKEGLKYRGKPIGNALNGLISAATLTVPIMVGARLGESGGEYAVSRWLQKHEKVNNASENKS